MRHAIGLGSALYPYALELADAATASLPLEARYPFFDRRLIEFCVSLPPRQKLHDGWTRAIMRRAIGGIVPERVQWRVDKADLSPNFARTLHSRDRETIRGLLSRQSASPLGAYVNLLKAREMFDFWSSDPFRRPQQAQALFCVATLGLWLDQASSTGSPTKVT
jgi:asparagine synthase (glutamine-hydrolysing)